MYSTKLIKEVKECFPDNPEMHGLADRGSVFLGRYLDDSSNDKISLDTILKATTLEELQKKARIAKRKVDCYKMWCEEDPRKK